jgi:hypothetical protein
VTERRRLATLPEMKGVPREERHARTPACYLCGQDMDSTKHLYSEECPVTMEARAKFSRLSGVNTEIEGISVYQTSLLLFPPTTKVVTQAICIFNAATWVERTNYFKLLAVPLPPEACANWLANAAYGFWRSHNGWNKIKRKKCKKARINRLQLISAAEEDTRSVLNDIDWATTITCYTNGTADKVGGQAGAGVCIELNNGVSEWSFLAGLKDTKCSIMGGLYAIGMALEFIVKLWKAGRMNNLSKNKMLIISNCDMNSINRMANSHPNENNTLYSRAINLIKKKKMSLINTYNMSTKIHWTPDTFWGERAPGSLKLASEGCLIANLNDNYRNSDKVNITHSLEEGRFYCPNY